ncbi:MAG: cysteine desulfurase [Candidatus Niyogibacteria bacterium]|nr:cysteine desulfurase [Candidatus Niyogibacteria bacterium]
MSSKKLIYLDHAATTPADPEVVLAMEPYWRDVAANPSSLHRCGQAAIKAVDEAREAIATFMGAAHPREIIFTGSATEANNLAIRGIVKNSVFDKPHVVTTAIEHASVLETVRALARQNFASQNLGGREQTGTIEATILPVGSDGRVSPDAVRAAVKENTALVSIGYANNEIGTLQPVAEIAKVIREFRKTQSPRLQPPASSLQHPVFHTDAVQAAPWLDVDVKKLGVDMMTISAHKMYGPKGAGALYVKDGIQLEPVIYGGGQEYGLRSGTENVPAIVGFAKAAEMTGEWKKSAANIGVIEKFRDDAWKEVQAIAPNAELNGPVKNRLPNNLNIFIPDVDPEIFLVALSEDGICVSSGSACAARALGESHVITAIGKGGNDGCHLRITFGRQTTEDDIRALVAAMKKRLSV